MINSIEDLRSGGVLPTGPVSAWPQERNVAGDKLGESSKPNKAAKATMAKMASGLVKTGFQALANGKVSKEIREERYDTCKACPLFNAESKRCNDCGCFMEAKTWVGGSPDSLCPQKKWKR